MADLNDITRNMELIGEYKRYSLDKDLSGDYGRSICDRVLDKALTAGYKSVSKWIGDQEKKYMDLKSKKNLSSLTDLSKNTFGSNCLESYSLTEKEEKLIHYVRLVDSLGISLEDPYDAIYDKIKLLEGMGLKNLYGKKEGKFVPKIPISDASPGKIHGAFVNYYNQGLRILNGKNKK